MEIYFADLKPEIQKEVLEFFGIDNESEMNWEFIPLFILEEPEKSN